jgi:hypothetical protein
VWKLVSQLSWVGFLFFSIPRGQRLSNRLDDHVGEAGSDESPKVPVTPTTAGHPHDLDPPSLVPSSAAQPPDSAKDGPSDMVVDSAETSSVQDTSRQPLGQPTVPVPWETISSQRKASWLRAGKSFES